MLNSRKFSPFLRNGLWAEAANNAMLLEHNLITKSREIGPIQHYFEKEKRSIFTTLQKFDQTCITTNHDCSNRAKLAYWDTVICAHFADGHPVNTYWVLNSKTQKNFFTKTWFSCTSQVVKPVVITFTMISKMRKKLEWFL